MNSYILSISLAVASLTSCNKNAVDSDSIMSIEALNRNASTLVNSRVKTQGVLEIYPDLRLFQDSDVRQEFGEQRLMLSIALSVEFDYDKVKSLKCYGRIVEVEGYVVKDPILPIYHLGGQLDVINSDGSICYRFE
jgi:hypothetical protein